MSDEPIEVSYQAILYSSRIPGRYLVALFVNDFRTGIQAYVWGRKRANWAMQDIIDRGNELINEYGLAEGLAHKIQARRREEAMEKVQVGDRVRLLVDIGTLKKGRVCKVVETAEPSFYVSRGVNEWHDEKYPVSVLPTQLATDAIALGPQEAIPLARGEFGPLDMEIPE